jgi:hypothetical protein
LDRRHRRAPRGRAAITGEAAVPKGRGEARDIYAVPVRGTTAFTALRRSRLHATTTERYTVDVDDCGEPGRTTGSGFGLILTQRAEHTDRREYPDQAVTRFGMHWRRLAASNRGAVRNDKSVADVAPHDRT